MRWLGNYLSNLGLRLLGPASVIWFILVTAVGGLFGIVGWHRARIKEGKPGVQNWHVLLTGIAGTWIFLSLTFGAAAYWIYQNQNMVAGAPTTQADAGPISWVYNLSMERAGMNGVNIGALRFRGANISKAHLQLKSAEITSLVDGTQLHLDIVATDNAGNSKIVPIDKVQLIPPGAPIEVVAKLGPPDPAMPGYVLGIDADTFLAKWRQFSFSATDDTRSYKMDFNENIMMVFFQGKVGPRVAIKPD
jgi:hypothetical protein